jgi:hypothetical protein
MKASEYPPSSVNGATLTTAPVQVPAPQPVTVARPEWTRLPKPGTLCPWTGLSRSKLWEVLQTGKVRNVCLRKPGAVRGARLIHLASLLAYLDSLASEIVPASETLNDDGDD